MNRHLLPRKAAAMLAISAIVAIGLVAQARPASAAPSQVSYIVAAHPDDEYSVWSLLTGASANYKVFIFLTRGEQTSGCRTQSEGASYGPYWYQGPSSPVGQPNYGEINPRGTGSNIWTGRWTSTCMDARMHGLLTFLDDKGAADPSIPKGFSVRGDYAPCTNNTAAGIPPQRSDASGVPFTSRGVRVYDAANGMGKVLFYDLGDSDLTKEEVRWAVECTRANKSLFGIPTTMPEVNAIGPFRHAEPAVHSNCQPYDQSDHRAVHEALFQYDMVNGKQWGRTCDNDPDAQPANGGRQNTVPSTEHTATIGATETTRTGSLQRRYGWLIPGYWDSQWSGPSGVIAPVQSFWGRFS